MTLEQVEELEKMKDLDIPCPVYMDAWTAITNHRVFVDAHVSFIRAHFGTKLATPYWNRLIEFRNHVNQKYRLKA